MILLQVALASRGLVRTCIVKQLFQVFSGLCQREKRDRDQNVVHTLRDAQNLHKFLERKAELAFRGAKTGSAKIIRS